MINLNRSLSILLLGALVLASSPALPARATGAGQISLQDTPAQTMVARMSPEERIGQLFLVSFTGTKTDNKSQIYDLIVNHYIGGTVLEAANDNFAAAPDTAASAYQLIAQLQETAYDPSQGTPVPTPSPQPVNANYIPLFIGLSQDGDGAPNDQILSGLTPLPDPMAIGATWNTDLAHQVGAVAGQELSTLGVNLLFGPPLDVLDSPGSTLGNGLAADVFGGDPYWVGAMGQAYISGLHAGSAHRLVVIAKHFPGQGSSDRPEGEEPATVVKSLEQLKQIELAPFFAVTGNAPDTDSVTDGLLVSHIRYQGLQGNIRSTTRPVSFDPKALSSILSLPQFTSWRQNGGLMVSDDLGSPTVRLFYDTSAQSFQATQVALDAFLAGNDLLYLGNIQSTEVPDNYTTVLKILDFFIQKYNQDQVFAQHVDDAVVRILNVKYRLYGNFTIGNVVHPQPALDQLGQSSTVTIDVARQSATLVSPGLADLDTVLPSPPSPRDRLVFLTDTRAQRQCSTCPQEPMLAVDALQNAVLRLYGTATGGPIPNYHLISYTFDDIAALLGGGTGNQSAESDLRQAQWIIINMLDAVPNQPETTTLHDFLTQRQDLLRDKHVLVFSFNAPYYLDATDISKLTAYYCLYSKSPAFVDVAARLLFQELAPSGSLPVSVAGAGYDLLTYTSPDPGQVIQLNLDLPPVATGTTTAGTIQPTITPFFKIGDTVTVRTGVIVDYNQHPVPDGTPVHFFVSSGGQGGGIQEVDTVSTQGVARASYSVARAGLLEIRAESNQAVTSEVLDITVSAEGFSVTVISPTQMAEPTATPRLVTTPSQSTTSPVAGGTLGFRDWITMLVFLCGCAAVAYWLGQRWSMRRGVRWAICTLLGGLLAYNYFALQFPGAQAFVNRTGLFGIVGVVVVGAAAGLGAGYAWTRFDLMDKRSDKTDKQKTG